MPGKPYPRIVSPPPGPKARAIIARDEAVTATCYIKEYPLVVARGEGAMVEDVDGNRFLDFMAGIAVCSTGHSHPEVVKAIKDAADRFLHICGGDFYYEGMAALAERLVKLAPGRSKKRVFFTNSGAEAVEGAMKLARHATRRTAFVAFKGAFHGRTYGALSLTSSKAKQHGGFGPFLPDVHHVPFGYCYRCEYGKTFPSCELFCVSIIEKDLFARHLDPRDVAAIFVEPIQGEGGYIVPPPGWLAALRELCDRHGILLVADEVQCGIGRTGKMFACELAGIEPDILLAAKGLGSGMPIGAIIANESVSTWESGSHGTTFGGNPVCCAAALATLEVVERDLLPHVKARGERLMAGLEGLAARHPVIGDVRGVGLMQGVELVADRATREPAGDLVHRLEAMAFAKGLLTLAAGRNVLRLAPPLVVDDGDVDIALEILGQCLEQLD
ncbi:MAG TPA: acetyl ornithine aminotransferase family protein [Gemmatimonadales bacterium]|jgi:4-aminobutyrate aminotransferase|nr:acetyl ornithine aminotransferase family protein [Gemmatimonadales bacterium]